MSEKDGKYGFAGSMHRAALVLRRSILVLAAAYGALSLTLLQAVVTAPVNGVYPQVVTHIWMAVNFAALCLFCAAFTSVVVNTREEYLRLIVTPVMCGVMTYLWIMTFFQVLPRGLQRIAEAKDLDDTYVLTMSEAFLRALDGSLPMFGN